MKKWEKTFKRLIVVIGISSLVLSSGCSSASNKTAAMPSEYSYESPAEKNDGVSEEQVITEEQSTDTLAGNAGESPKVNTNSSYNRKVIKTGNMEIQTEKFGETVGGITNCVISLGGYIENSNIQGSSFYNRDSNNRTATLTVRIPQAQFDNFVNRGSEFGNVSYLSCNSEDITSAYVDTEIRLKTLKARYERLLILLEKSGTLKELFELEQEISNVTYEIESLSGTLSHYDALVDMGTITIQVQEVKEIKAEKEAEPSFGKEVQEAFNNSIEGLLEIGKSIIIFITTILPFVVIMIPFILIGVKLYKRNNKKKTALEKKEEEKRE